MSDTEIKLQKLFIHEPAYASTFADIYVGRSSHPERASQHLILIISYPRSKYADQSLLTAIMQQAVRTFEDSRHATPELTLEATLETLNISLPDLAPRRDPKWLASLTILVALSDNDQLHFASIGDIQAFLVQDASITRVSEQQQHFNPLKLFSHITSGLLEPGNTILFTTASLVDYISIEKIRKILHEVSPQRAEQRLTSLLTQVPPSVSFESVIIKFTTEFDELAERGYQSADIRPAVEAVAAYETTFDATEQRLQRQAPIQHQGTRRDLRSWTSTAWLFLRLFLRALYVYLKLVYASIVLLAKGLWKLVAALFLFRERIAREHSFIQLITNRYSEFKEQLLRLPKRSRSILWLTALLIFILLHVVMIKGQYRQVQKVRSSFDETLVLIAQKKEAVDNAIIYNDEKIAEKLLSEIRALLRGVTPANKNQEDQIAGYLEDNNRELNKIRHINDIPTPFVFADLSASGASFQHLIHATDGSYLISSDSTLSRWKDGKVAEVAIAPGAIGRIFLSGSNTFVTTVDNAFLRLTDSTLAPASFTAHSEQKAITAASLYANNLYVLDAGSKSIFKYNGTSGGIFSTGTIWARDDALAQARDITIDGNLYSLGTDGRITKYSRGQRVDFSYHEPVPRIGDTSKIYTTKESNYLYVLDPENKRVIIMEKQGAIKDQFASKEFTNLTDLAILPDESSVAVLSGPKIYLIAITQ